jgi:hypothetical protein
MVENVVVNVGTVADNVDDVRWDVSVVIDVVLWKLVVVTFRSEDVAALEVVVSLIELVPEAVLVWLAAGIVDVKRGVVVLVDADDNIDVDNVGTVVDNVDDITIKVSAGVVGDVELWRIVVVAIRDDDVAASEVVVSLIELVSEAVFVCSVSCTVEVRNAVVVFEVVDVDKDIVVGNVEKTVLDIVVDGA